MVGMPARISISGLATARIRGVGVFGQVDRGEQPDRHRDEQRDERDVERAPEQRQDARDRSCRGSVGAQFEPEEEVLPRILAEEVDRLEQHRQDDADRRQDRDRGRGAQEDEHAALDAVARAEVLRQP